LSVHRPPGQHFGVHLRQCAAILTTMVGNDIHKARSLGRAARVTHSSPSVDRWAATLRERGYVLIPDHLPRDTCVTWAAAVTELAPAGPEPSGPPPDARQPYTIATSSRTVPLPDGAVAEFRRIGTPEADDSGVVCIYHVDRLMPALTQLRSDPTVAAVIFAAGGEELPSRAFKAFVHASVRRTQGYHVDNDGEVCYKAFFALTDIGEAADGAHSYLPGSHRARWTKYRNVLRNTMRADRYPRAMDRIPASAADTVLCRAGSVLIVDVNGIHRALPQADGRVRVVLVNCFDRSDYPVNLDPPVRVTALA